MSQRQPLLETLRAAHLRVGLAALVATAIVLTLVSFITLRGQVERNLTLVARSLAYTTEAAVVFGDAAAAQEAVTQVAEREGLGAVRVVDLQGRTLARYDAPADSRLEAAASELATVLFAQGARADIVSQGRRHGEIQVQGLGAASLIFLLKVMAAIALCTAANVWLVARLSRRIDSDIVRPLNRLAALTRKARVERALTVRAPAAAVREIHELGEDFNALLAEVESREARLQAKQERLRHANESLSYLAFHDNLTGLPNRASFLERAGAILQSQAGDTATAALLFLDCDRFKEVNDELGHAAGDELLVQVARRIRAQLRDGDFVARLGGDEFAVLLCPVRGAEDAERIAHNIARAIREPIDSVAYRPIRASASIGVALLSSTGSLEQWLAAADAAMYRAKARSPGSVGMFEPRTDDLQHTVAA